MIIVEISPRFSVSLSDLLQLAAVPCCHCSTAVSTWLVFSWFRAVGQRVQLRYVVVVPTGNGSASTPRSK